MDLIVFLDPAWHILLSTLPQNYVSGSLNIDFIFSPNQFIPLAPLFELFSRNGKETYKAQEVNKIYKYQKAAKLAKFTPLLQKLHKEGGLLSCL